MEKQSEAAKEVAINMENTEGLHYEDLVDESSTRRSNQEIQEPPMKPKVPKKKEGTAPISHNNEKPPDLPLELHFLLNKDESPTPISNQQPEGPRYQRNCQLKKSEKLKTKLAWQYCKTRDKVDLYKRVKEVSIEAREFYEPIRLEGFTEEAFPIMMFLDGCCILEFIKWFLGVKDYYDIGMNNNDIANVKRDLFLLDNQLPYIVLEALMKGNEEYDLYEWKKGIKNFINMCRTLPSAIKPWMSGSNNFFFLAQSKDEFQTPLHLLDMTRTRFVKQSATFPSRHLKVPVHCHTPCATSSYHSTRVLKSMGI
nr:uncharacterized protein LOC107403330 [Ziziphus jujuba var. spinosa]